MPYAVHYLDRANAGDVRQRHREAHIAYRKGLGDKLLLAGPLLSEDGKPVGSLVLLEAGSLSEAKNVAQSDPYAVRDSSIMFWFMATKSWRSIFGQSRG